MSRSTGIILTTLIAAIVVAGAVFTYFSRASASYVASSILRLPTDVRSDLLLPVYSVTLETRTDATVLLRGATIVISSRNADPRVAAAPVSRIMGQIMTISQEIVGQRNGVLADQTGRFNKLLASLDDLAEPTRSLSAVALATLGNQLSLQKSQLANFQRWVFEQKSNAVDVRKEGVSPVIAALAASLVVLVMGFMIMRLAGGRRGEPTSRSPA